MSGSFKHLLSLAIVSIVAYIVADILASKPIYESLLEKFLHNQGEKIFCWAIIKIRLYSSLQFAWAHI